MNLTPIQVVSVNQPRIRRRILYLDNRVGTRFASLRCIVGTSTSLVVVLLVSTHQCRKSSLLWIIALFEGIFGWMLVGSLLPPGLLLLRGTTGPFLGSVERLWSAGALVAGVPPEGCA
jgi:hypothetical protein